MVNAGWYTEAAMKDELGYDARLDVILLDPSLATCGTQLIFFLQTC